MNRPVAVRRVVVYGMTPKTIFQGFAYKKTKELLKKGYSVTRVCFDVGYESLPTGYSIV
jgi:methylphosphotriester-DNA--protein-cysteine methyltransferase